MHRASRSLRLAIARGSAVRFAGSLPGRSPAAPAGAADAPRGLVGASGSPVGPGPGSPGSAAGAGHAQIHPLNPQTLGMLAAQTPTIVCVGTADAATTGQLTRLAAAAAGKVQLASLDVKLYPQVAQQLGVRTTPTLLLVAQGQLFGSLPPTSQGLPKEEVATFLQDIAEKLGISLPHDVSDDLADVFSLLGPDGPAPSKRDIILKALHKISMSPDLTAGQKADLLAAQVRCGAATLSDLETLAVTEKGRPEVKRAFALSTLAGMKETEPVPKAVIQFFKGEPSLEVALAEFKSSRTDQDRQVVLALLDAVQASDEAKAVRRRLANLLFI